MGYSMRQTQTKNIAMICGFLMSVFAVPFKFSVYGLHKSIGVLIFLFLVIRIFNRFNFKIPKLPTAIKKFERIAAKIAVFFLYLGIITMPVSGYLMSVYYDYKALFLA
ncbi:MAG: cytochrome b/b6 domain-containing protein [Candidatus Midichloria sp.]|nr:cytochrome b/b6 domain-containing protein [Candidatus Midichloria sp.]